jgi:MtrB/PioB family decaheme-associated outer membrane protein
MTARERLDSIGSKGAILAIAALICAAGAPAAVESESSGGIPASVSPLRMAFQEERAKAGASSDAAKPAGPQTWHLFTEFGVSTYDLDGALPGKFQEYRDVPRGFFLRALDLTFVDKDSPYIAWLRARDVREQDQRIEAEVWRVGLFRTQVSWDEIPRFYSRSPTLEQVTGPGILQVSPAIRAAFQGAVDGQPPQNVPPSFFDLVRSELAVAPRVDVGFRRETGSFRQSVSPADGLELHFGALHIHKSGSRPVGTGTFARQAIGPAGDGIWEALGVELPAPIDDRTDSLNVGTRLSGTNWRVGLDYDYTFYRNRFSSITYENPFRITDAIATTPGGNVGRERFVRAQLATPPETDFQRVTLRAGWDLPRDTQVRGLFAWSQSKQNDPFLPFTLNTALTSPDLPGQSLTSLATLPARSLNGKIVTTDQNYAVVSRAIHSMTFRLEYRSEHLDNRSPEFVFPGVSRFGDSFFLTAVDYYNVPIVNRPTSFIRQDGIASGRWDFSPALTTTLEYHWQAWNRTFRDAPRTDENSGKIRLDFTPSTAVTVRADYQYGKRSVDLYKTVPFTFVPATNTWVVTPQTQFDPTVPLEFNLLRRYDETARTQHDGSLWADVRLGKEVTLSASYRYLRDDYAEGFYGLTFDEARNVTAELTWTPGEHGYFYANYSHQQNRLEYLGIGHLIPGAVPGVTACCAQYPIANTWDRNSNSHLDTLLVGVNLATDGERWMFDGSYSISDARDVIHTFNPFPIQANSPLTATAYNYPDTKNRYQELLASVTYRIRPGLQVGVRYRYEPYAVDDFYLNNLQPYAQGSLTAGGVPVNVQRYIFLNSRYGNYTANQVAAFVRYKY